MWDKARIMIVPFSDEQARAQVNLEQSYRA
jgi:hypothetical protein